MSDSFECPDCGANRMGFRSCYRCGRKLGLDWRRHRVRSARKGSDKSVRAAGSYSGLIGHITAKMCVQTTSEPGGESVFNEVGLCCGYIPHLRMDVIVEVSRKGRKV